MSATSEGDELEPRPQWDSFFKRLIPGSDLIQDLAEAAFNKKQGDLTITRSMNGDMASSRVAAALHLTGFKALRSDGIHFVCLKDAVVAYEYQSTHNSGMRLRFAMYQEAFLETSEEYEEHEWLRVLVYSGDDAPEYYRDRHGEVQPGYLPYLVLDMSSVRISDWLKRSLVDAVLGLSLREASKIELFEWVLKKINHEVSDAFEAATLRTGVLLATLNKTGLWPKVLRKIAMDSILDQEVKKFLPEYERLRRQHESRDLINKLVRLLENRQGTEYIIERMQEMTEDEFDQEKDEIWEAVITGQEQTLARRI